MSLDFDAIIVGGGHNGLVAAAYLARAGLRVGLFERRAMLGGACVTEELFPGYHFSTCSYLCYLLQPKLVDELELRRFGFEVFPIEPWRFLPLPDGRRLLLWNETERVQEEIARFSAADARAYPRWVEFWAKAVSLVEPFLFRPPPSAAEMQAHADALGLGEFYQRLVAASMAEVLCEFFEHDVVRAAFTHAHDVGDLDAPGGAWCYTHIKCTTLCRPGDVGLVRGGMGGITKAMAASARHHGADLRTSAPVEGIVVDDRGAAVGIRLEDGTVFRSRVVLSNADPKRTFGRLLGAVRGLEPVRSRVAGLSTQAAYFKFHAALSGVPDCSRYFAADGPAFDPRFLGEMKVCPSMEYYRRSWREACAGYPSTHPVMEVQMPTGYDPGLAPAGKHLLSVWALYAPTRLKQGSYTEVGPAMGETLLRELSTFMPNLRQLVEQWAIYSPMDMEERVGLTDGNIRHLDMIPSQWLWNRPVAGWGGYRTPVRGLYLCGAGTHPGGEVTGLPGHNAAMQVLGDVG